MTETPNYVRLARARPSLGLRRTPASPVDRSRSGGRRRVRRRGPCRPGRPTRRGARGAGCRSHPWYRQTDAQTLRGRWVSANRGSWDFRPPRTYATSRLATILRNSPVCSSGVTNQHQPGPAVAIGWKSRPLALSTKSVEISGQVMGPGIIRPMAASATACALTPLPAAWGWTASICPPPRSTKRTFDSGEKTASRSLTVRFLVFLLRRTPRSPAPMLRDTTAFRSLVR